MIPKICTIHGSHCDGKCVDPNVDNGMMTKVWGPSGWLFLHCITFGYPYYIDSSNPDHAYKKQQYKLFFESLANVFPCKYCRESYKEFINDVKIDRFLNTREDLCKWLYLIHNKVNHKLGVPNNQIPSFKEVKTYYEQFRAKCKKTSEEERVKNKEKGCIRPADGTPKRCLIQVVKCNPEDMKKTMNCSNSLMNINNWVGPFIILLIINLILYKYGKLFSKMFN